VEYATIGQVVLKTEGVDEEPPEQLMLHATNDDAEVGNDIDDDNLDTDHDDADDDVDVDNRDADHDDEALLYLCSINDILRTIGFPSCALVAEELHVVSSDEPTSFVEAERCPS
jgi:hypothetical protein